MVGTFAALTDQSSLSATIQLAWICDANATINDKVVIENIIWIYMDFGNTMGTGSFPGVRRRGVVLTTHPHLAPRLRNEWNYTFIPSLSLFWPGLGWTSSLPLPVINIWHKSYAILVPACSDFTPDYLGIAISFASVTLALDEGDWSANVMTRATDSFSTRWTGSRVDPRDGPDSLEMKIFCPCRKSRTTIPRLSSPRRSCSTDWAIPALLCSGQQGERC